MKLTEIQDLIKFVSKSGVNEVELETKEIKIVIKTGKSVPVMVQAAPSQVITTPTHVVTNQPVHTPVTEQKSTSTPTNNGVDESKYLTIKSPMIGTFYRSEERRVGKECRSRWSPDDEKKKRQKRKTQKADNCECV